MKQIAALIATFIIAISASAQNYIVIGQITNIYSEPSSTAEPMVNQFDDLIDLLPGMVFATKGEQGDFWKIDFPGWRGLWVPKEACTSPQALDFTPGTYPFVYESTNRPITFTATETEGVYQASGDFPTLTATLVSPGVLVLTDPRWPEETAGCVSRISGKLHVWIYDTTVLPWN